MYMHCMTHTFKDDFQSVLRILVESVLASWLVHLTLQRASGPGSSPGWGHCVVFLGQTLYSHGASFLSGV